MVTGAQIKEMVEKKLKEAIARRAMLPSEASIDDAAVLRKAAKELTAKGKENMSSTLYDLANKIMLFHRDSKEQISDEIKTLEGAKSFLWAADIVGRMGRPLTAKALRAMGRMANNS